MKKKICVFILVAIMLFTFAACGESETNYAKAGNGIASFGNKMNKVATFTLGGSKPLYFGFDQNGLLYLYTFALTSNPNISPTGTYGSYLISKGSNNPGYTCDSQFDGDWFSNIYYLLLTFKAELPIEIYDSLESIAKNDYYSYTTSNGSDHLLMLRRDNLVLVIPSTNALMGIKK